MKKSMVLACVFFLAVASLWADPEFYESPRPHKPIEAGIFIGPYSGFFSLEPTLISASIKMYTPLLFMVYHDETFPAYIGALPGLGMQVAAEGNVFLFQTSYSLDFAFIGYSYDMGFGVSLPVFSGSNNSVSNYFGSYTYNQFTTFIEYPGINVLLVQSGIGRGFDGKHVRLAYLLSMGIYYNKESKKQDFTYGMMAGFLF